MHEPSLNTEEKAAHGPLLSPGPRAGPAGCRSGSLMCNFLVRLQADKAPLLTRDPHLTSWRTYSKTERGVISAAPSQVWPAVPGPHTPLWDIMRTGGIMPSFSPSVTFYICLVYSARGRRPAFPYISARRWDDPDSGHTCRLWDRGRTYSSSLPVCFQGMCLASGPVTGIPQALLLLHCFPPLLSLRVQSYRTMHWMHIYDKAPPSRMLTKAQSVI